MLSKIRIICILFAFVLATTSAYAAGIHIGSGCQMKINNGKFNIGGIVDIYGALSVGSGSISATSNVAINAGSSLTMGSGSISIGGNWAKNGAFSPGTGTVTFNGSAAQTVTGDNVFYNLIINNSHASEKVDASGSNSFAVQNNLEVADGIFKSASAYHNVNIGAGAVLELNGDITVSGNWHNGNGLNGLLPGTFEVNLNGANQTVSGMTTFYDLTKQVSSSDTLSFEGGINSLTTVTNALNLQGASGGLLSLRSDSATQWEIDPQGSRTVQYLDVQNSKNINSDEIDAIGKNCVDSGGNTGWIFVDPTGSLQVTITPQGAIDAGAQWRRTGTSTWYNSGSTENGIPVGSVTVEFKSVTGWTAPGTKSVTITSGQTATESGTYIQQTGSLQVTITPQGAIDAGAQWRRTGTSTWYNGGSTESGIPVGSVTVEFKSVTGWTAPANKSVTITSGQTTTESGTYTQETGSLTVTITPQGAIDAGAQWRRTGTETWRESGSTEAGVPMGSQTVEFKAISGWTAPDNKSVTVSSGQTTTTSGTYTENIGPGIYYLNGTTGNDANDGSADHPWKTFHNSVNRFNNADDARASFVLYVASGTYSQGEPDEPLTLSQSDVIIIGESTIMPIIDGSSSQSWTTGLKITGSNVSLKNMAFTGFKDSGEEGIRIEGGDGNEIVDCSIYNNDWGIRVNNATRTTIYDCQVYENITHGIDLTWSTDTRVLQNTVWGNLLYGIRIQCSPEITRNLMYDNSYGILVAGVAGDTVSPTIENNVIYRSESGNMAYGIFIRSNSSSVANPLIYHNTLDGGLVNGITMEKDGTSTSAPIIKYNIITGFSRYGVSNSGAGPTLDYNDVWGNTTANYHECEDIGSNSISLDPRYAGYDLQIESDSPCIDKIPATEADPVTIDYRGYKRPRPSVKKKDMGAYEYVSKITNNYTLPGGTGLATDYRIFSVPFFMTGARLLSQMEAVLGPYDPSQWRGFGYSGLLYQEFDRTAFKTTAIVPGMGFWIITVLEDTIPFEGRPAPDGVDYRMRLSYGWRLIAVPWAGRGIKLEDVKVTNGVNTWSITDTNNTLTQKFVWDFTGDGPDNGYTKRDTGTYELQPGVGYFLNVLPYTGVRIIFPVTETVAADKGSEMIFPAEGLKTENSDLPPPPPGMAPTPDIEVNGQDGPLILSSDDSVSVSVSLNPGNWKDRNSDWWIAVHTPFVSPYDWFSYSHSNGWQSGIEICAQLPLFEINTPFQVLKMKIPVGKYTFYFAVDGNDDGKPDATWMDSVQVEVK